MLPHICQIMRFTNVTTSQCTMSIRPEHVVSLYVMHISGLNARMLAFSISAVTTGLQKLTIVEKCIILSKFDEVVFLFFFIQTLPTISEGLTARYRSNSKSVTWRAISIGWSYKSRYISIWSVRFYWKSETISSVLQQSWKETVSNLRRFLQH